METTDDCTPKWQPPQRPEWVKRINEEGKCLDIHAVVPLDDNSLLNSAMTATGLSDFGADDWHEPFIVLINAVNEEADLNLIGRIRMRSELLQLLQARLQIEAIYKLSPEIEDETIAQPINIVGQGRSGTSLLQNVLAANPDNGALLQWEAMYPCPPPQAATYRTDPRIEKANRLIKQWNRVTPTMVSVHEFGGTVPIEDCAILSLNFMSPSWFGCFAQVPSYDAYMAKVDYLTPLRYHQRVLMLLQWKNPRQHWVLKEVPHLDRMASILKVYPDACFVWPHRDPVRALASGISAIGTLQYTGTDHVFKGGSLDWISDPELSAARFNKVIGQLESGVVPPKQIYHLHYKDLISDTIGTLDAMYRHFEIKLSDSGRRAMTKYISDNPRDSRPPHKLAMAVEDVIRARQAYKAYQEYFKITDE